MDAGRGGGGAKFYCAGPRGVSRGQKFSTLCEIAGKCADHAVSVLTLSGFLGMNFHIYYVLLSERLLLFEFSAQNYPENNFQLKNRKFHFQPTFFR